MADNEQHINRDGETNNKEIHHDRMNEFGEETWSALGENQESLSNLSESNVVTTSNTRIFPELVSETNVPEATKHPLVMQGSSETYENKEFLTEEVATLGSFISDATTKQSKQDDHLSRKDEEDSVYMSAAASLSSKISITRRVKNADFCRICHDASSTLSSFISPCNCRGSLSLVHKACLEHWLAESDSSHCELCGQHFRMVRFPRYGIFTSMVAWLTSTTTRLERKRLIIDVLVFIILSPIICLANYMALQIAEFLFPSDELIDSATSTNTASLNENDKGYSNTIYDLFSRLGQLSIFSMVVTLDMAFITWALLRIQRHTVKWYLWYRRNCHVTLLGYPEVNVSIPQDPSASSTNVQSITF